VVLHRARAYEALDARVGGAKCGSEVLWEW